MVCEARHHSDGSWLCQKCGIAGDRDEPVEQYCKREEVSGAEKDRDASDRQ